MDYREQSIILFLIISSLIAWSHLVEGSRWTLSMEEDLEIERQLKLLNKPYVKSFKTEHGDTFDCVNIFKQPSLDHPLLKNHKVQYAGIVIQTDNNKYYGAQALLDVYNVQNVSDNQASTVQVILSQETGPANYQNVIQFGWQVNPSVATDKQVRLFTYWTSDGYQSAGCYNLLCLGFVLTGTNWTPGMVIPNGTPSLKLKSFKDSDTGDWWLAVGDSEEPIGYWPKELFKNNMTDIAEVQMAGIVYSPYNEPSPPMCNGWLPNPNDPNGSKSCEVKQIRVKIAQGSFADPEPVLVKAIYDITEYYDVASYRYDGPSNGFVFDFGGPGGYKRG